MLAQVIKRHDLKIMLQINDYFEVKGILLKVHIKYEPKNWKTLFVLLVAKYVKLSNKIYANELNYL